MARAQGPPREPSPPPTPPPELPLEPQIDPDPGLTARRQALLDLLIPEDMEDPLSSDEGVAGCSLLSSLRSLPCSAEVVICGLQD